MSRQKLDKHDQQLKREKKDIEFLLALPGGQFKRFCWRVIQLAGLFDRAPTDGSEGAVHAHMARRNLGLAILDMVETGQPAAHPDGVPVFTLLQTLLEEANPPPSEGTNDEDEHEERYDRTADLDLAD